MGTTPHGLAFTGAFTFGESQRLPWVKKDDLIASKLEIESCKKFDDQMRRTDSRLSSKIRRRKSNLPQDEKMKPIKSQTPPVGAQNLHNIQVIDEEQIKSLMERAQNKEQKDKTQQMYTIQTQIGKRMSGGDLDLHQTWAIQIVKEIQLVLAHIIHLWQINTHSRFLVLFTNKKPNGQKMDHLQINISILRYLVNLEQNLTQSVKYLALELFLDNSIQYLVVLKSQGKNQEFIQSGGKSNYLRVHDIVQLLKRLALPNRLRKQKNAFQYLLFFFHAD